MRVGKILCDAGDENWEGLRHIVVGKHKEKGYIIMFYSTSNQHHTLATKKTNKGEDNYEKITWSELIIDFINGKFVPNERKNLPEKAQSMYDGYKLELDILESAKKHDRDSIGRYIQNGQPDWR